VALQDDGPAAHVGRYEIRRELGRGTMGVVYEAHDPTLGRTVALKTVSLGVPDPAEFERRFQAEARIAAGLSHPGIVVVHDVGRDAGRVVFIAFEYLQGRTLAEVLGSEGALPWREALRIVARVAEALHYAHDRGVVHRDVKPANIMLLASGEPKIMDFGVAKAEASQLTAPGQLFGTPLYMAPEQALGQPVDRRADLFSLGSVLYALVTGRPPFEAAELATVLARVAHGHPKPPSALLSGLPPDLDYVIARAMAKAPEQRYADARSFGEDLEDLLAGRPPRHRAGWTMPPAGQGTLVSAPRVEPPAPMGETAARAARPRRRGRRLVLVGLLVALAALYFELHPEHRAFWREQERRFHGRERLLAAAGWVRGLVAQPTAPAVPSALSSPSPSAAGTPASPAAPPSPPVESPPVATPFAEASPPAEQPPDPASAASPASADPAPGHAAEPSSRDLPAAPTPIGSPEASAPASLPARLVIDFEHHLKSGTLQVWVDGRAVLKEALDSRVERKILFLERRRGSEQQVLAVPPGRHEVRVEVDWEKKRRSARTAAVFGAGVTRRLEARVKDDRVELAWKGPR
jgi:eukaryotic-like serine/threonine-protein kinase